MKTLLSVIFFACSMSVNAQLQIPERQITTYVRDHMQESVKLLEQLVNINSGSLNVEGVRRIGEVLAREFEKIGFVTSWIQLPDSLKRAGHLVATRTGKKGKKTFTDRPPGYCI